MGFVDFTEDQFSEDFNVFRFGEFQSEAVDLKSKQKNITPYV